MTRKKRKARTQQKGTGHIHPNASSSPNPHHRRNQETVKGDGNQDAADKQDPHAAEQGRPQKLSSQKKTPNNQNGTSRGLSAQKHSKAAPPATASHNYNNIKRKPACRTRTRSQTQKKTQKNLLSSAQSQTNTNNASHSTSTSPLPEKISLLARVNNRIAQREQHRGQPGHGTASRLCLPYFRSSEALLPYDVDGASAREQRAIIQTNPPDNDNHVFDEATTGTNQQPCTVIQENPAYLLRLQQFVATQDALRQAGYVVEPLSKANLEGKNRCLECGKPMSKLSRKMRSTSSVNVAGEESENPTWSGARSRSFGKTNFPLCLGGAELVGRHPDAEELAPNGIIRCRFHNGQMLNKTWTCCRQHVSSKPCTGAEQHRFRQYSPGELYHLWQFHVTPALDASLADTSQIRCAVAIDCEMGTAVSGDSELIRITLIDYFSTTKLIDSLVYPTVPMRDYKSRFSGVTRSDMEAARRQGRCIMGSENARRAVWKYVGPDTVVVGHSANNDLAALRWIHTVVVDTFLIEKDKDSGTNRNNRENEKQEVDADIDGEKGREGGGVAATAEALGQLSLSSPISLSLPLKPVIRDTATKTSLLQRREKKRNGSGRLSLKTLSLTRLGREIQTAGKKGHDSFEDALAARDLVHWHIVHQRPNSPDQSQE